MTRFTVRIIPNASSNEVVGFENGAWKIRLMVPPIEGKANKALIEFLADKLDLAPSEIDIVKGLSSKMKSIKVPMHEEDIKMQLDGGTMSS